MTDIRTVTPDFAVAPQLTPEDMAEAARRGFKLVINNRPDGEVAGQPTSGAMEQAARAAGLDYLYVPVNGRPALAEVEAVRAAMADAGGPTLAFCRSGTRSIVTWALGEAQSGARSPQELNLLGKAAGYDLAPVLGG